MSSKVVIKLNTDEMNLWDQFIRALNTPTPEFDAALARWHEVGGPKPYFPYMSHEHVAKKILLGYVQSRISTVNNMVVPEGSQNAVTETTNSSGDMGTEPASEAGDSTVVASETQA